MAGIGRQDAVAERLEVALQVRERRPQLVGRVDDELAADRLLLGQPLGHRVVGGRERAQLGRSVLGHADRQVAVGDLPRRAGEALDRAREASGEDDREQQGHHGGDRGRDEEHDGHALVEHRAGVVGRVAGGHHERLEDVPADAEHADRDDRERHGHDDQRRGEDPAPDAADPHDGRASPAPPLDRAGRPVAGAADGRDVARRVGIVAELLAQPLHVDVDGPVGDVALGVAVERVEQPVAAQHAAVRLEQHLEQPELERAQGHLAAAHGHPVAGRVELQVAEDETVAGGVVGRALRPAEDRPDAGHELGRRERLRQVVVGALAQAEDPVADRAARRQDEDRHVAVGPGPPDHRHPVDLGEHQVEDDEAGRVLLDRAQRGPSVAGGDDRVALALEVRADEGDDLRVVVDDEDGGVGSGGHEGDHRPSKDAGQR